MKELIAFVKNLLFIFIMGLVYATVLITENETRIKLKREADRAKARLR